MSARLAKSLSKTLFKSLSKSLAPGLRERMIRRMIRDGHLVPGAAGPVATYAQSLGLLTLTPRGDGGNNFRFCVVFAFYGLFPYIIIYLSGGC